MIRCSKCAGSNPAGAVFCSECGALLPAAGSSPAPDLGSASMMRSPKPSSPVDRPAAGADNWATLHFLDSGHALGLMGNDEFTMGRSAERQPSPPDIDLSSYHAYSNGVSRLHASIRRRGSRVVLMDLGSANGTYINGRRLGAREEEILTNGDVIALGKLKIQVRLKAA